jgi:hypothetical protein
MFANTQMAGNDMGFPDVCLTPSPAGPVPIPYPNISVGCTGAPAAYTVMYMCMPAHNMTTTSIFSNGDNAGVSMGVASGTVMGPDRHLVPVATVLVCGIPVTRLTAGALQNSTNCPGLRAVPSQAKVLILSP